MAKFKLSDRVRRLGQQEVRTVEEIRENPAAETLYSIQLGSDSVTRVWAKESELELVSTGNRVMARPVDSRDKHVSQKKIKSCLIGMACCMFTPAHRHKEERLPEGLKRKACLALPLSAKCLDG